MNISVVIVSYNSAKELPECLTSISKLKTSYYAKNSQDRQNLKLKTIVVDNASTDDSIKVASSFEGVEIIKNDKNLGFSAGNNIGIKLALKDRSDAVLILNPDTTVDQNLILELVKAVSQDKNIGIVSPKIYFFPHFEFHKDRYKKNDLGKVIWYAGGAIDWQNVLASHRGADQVDKCQYDKVEETEFATGAAMMIKKEVFDTIGLFDERFFLYLEDLDFCIRAKRAGFKIFYNPKAIIWHKWAQSAKGGSSLQDYFITRNRLLFGLKYAPLRSKIALLRQAIKFLFENHTKRQAVFDFLIGKFGKGSDQLSN